MKILYLVNCSNFFCSHFLQLAVSAKAEGHEVIIAAGNNEQQQKIEELGFTFVEYTLSRSGKSLRAEFNSFFKIYKLIRIVRPDLLHALTIKPILYGCIANMFNFKFGAPKVAASVTGLGSSSLSTDLVGKLLWFFIRLAYKLSFSSKRVGVIFENSDDMEQFISLRLVNRQQSFLVNGAGVDTVKFSPSFTKFEVFSIILVARLLKDKGIREYIEAGHILKASNKPIRLLLVGTVDPGNPSSMSVDDIQSAHDHGYIEYLGFRSDIAELYKSSHVACLPSYREGLPKSLIEAAACGLPIITTDVPGCRQLVQGNNNGFLVPARNSIILAKYINELYENQNLVNTMGHNSRDLAGNKFDYEKVIPCFFMIYNSIGNEK